MDPVGLPIQSSLAGVSQTERQQASARAARERAADRPRRAADESDLDSTLTQTEAVEAPRSAKGNDQEEAHEDRQAQDRAGQSGPRPRLDVEG
ncbi:MAG: hypothetical protein D6693_00560 [Planctomycetota bacterium]|nr:MAG: hypothetical protein D6693_00560 [Planctomycetota bacterium]